MDSHFLIIISAIGVVGLFLLILYKVFNIHLFHNNYEHKITLLVYFWLRVYVLISLIISLYLKSYYNAFLCGITLVLFLIPSFIERQFKIEIPQTMEIIILLFIFSAEMLGEINSFYVRIPMWDTILHTINGFLCAAVGYAMVDLLNTSERFSLKLSPVFLVLVSFCFSMTIGVLWEFFEFGADQIFHTDMQKDSIIEDVYSVSLRLYNVNDIEQTTIVTKDGKEIIIDGYLDIGLIDTMSDLLVNFIGAVVFSALGYLAKNKYIMDNFVPRLKRNRKELENET